MNEHSSSLSPLKISCFVGAALAATAFSAEAARPNTRVVNGQTGTRGDLRSTVALTDSAGYHGCTGTLVSPQVVMTAAHCVETERGEPQRAGDVRVTIGLLDVNDANANLSVSYRVARIYPACEYFETGGQGTGPVDDATFGRGDDIAFLRLESPVDASAMAPTPILPASRLSEVVVGASVRMTGYGISDLASQSAGVLFTGVSNIARFNNWEIATTRSADGRASDSCNGDSGGPLYLESGAPAVVGVVSRGNADSNFDCGDGGIYTFAPAYRTLYESALNGADVAACNSNPNPNPDPGPGPGPGPGTGEPGGPDLSLDEFVDLICNLDCCVGAPGENHSLCGACSAAQRGRQCEDPDEAVPTAELDEIQTFICEECAQGLENAVCNVCDGTTPPTEPNPPTEPTTPEPTEPGPAPTPQDPGMSKPDAPSPGGMPQTQPQPGLTTLKDTGGCSATRMPASDTAMLLLVGLLFGFRRKANR